jgi:hypothetical protein
MSRHRHDWQPWPLLRGRYRCDCGAVGKRIGTGAVAVEGTTQPAPCGFDAQPTNPRRAPTLDDYDRGLA